MQTNEQSQPAAKLLEVGKLAIFKNDYKTKETHPDFKGKVEIDGKEYQYSGWNSLSKNGLPYINGKLSVQVESDEQLQQYQQAEANSIFPASGQATAQAQPAAQPQPQQQGRMVSNDEIPF